MSFVSPALRPIAELVRLTVRGESDLISEIDVAQARAVAHADLNPIAFADWDRARRTAREIHAMDPATRSNLRLAGVLVSVKDLFQVPGMPMRAGTRASLPPVEADSTVARRLAQAGAIIFAKTNMHEIALGATGENGWTGDVKNPYDPTRQAGGSSSGAGVAVACGIGAAAIGSDTGGSVRIPAAFCGVVGFKPGYGAIPLDGALPLSWTCDHAGPLTRSVVDARLLFEVLSGRSTRHGRSPQRPRFGVPAGWLRGRLSAQVRDAFERELSRLRAHSEVIDVDIPTLPLAWKHYTPIVRAEAAHVHRAALAVGGDGFSESVRGPMEAGRQVSAGEYVEALEARARLSRDLDHCLARIDGLLLPSTAILPPPRGQVDAQVEGGTLSVREAVLGQTLPFSFAGLPTLSIPVALVDGLPMGLQLVGRRDADASLLALGEWLERKVSSAG